jgi:putative ATP-dependent endonuclease of OLD family
LRWPKGCLEENIIEHVATNDMEKFITDPDGESGDRLRTLALRLKIEDKTYAAVLAAAGNPANLRRLIIQAATGSVPVDARDDQKKTFKSHGKKWFKTVEGGSELGAKMLEFGVWPKLEGQLLPFLNAILRSVDLPIITELPHE